MASSTVLLARLLAIDAEMKTPPNSFLPLAG
jgi:hypothetical protein